MKRIACVIFFGLLLLHLISACGHGGKQDSDNDGLSDGDEIQVYGTDPYNADTDGDGRGDGEEVLAGTNPLVADYARALTLNNTAGKDVTVYIVFVGGLTGNGGSYTEEDFKNQSCDMYRSDRCSLTIPKGTSKTLNLSKGCINLSGGLDHEPMGPCPTTMFEINMCPKDNTTHDHFDLSLVNGFNYSMQISSSTGISTTHVTKATGNHDAVGVFPLGCTQCVSQGSNPPRWPSCPGNPSSCGAQCFSANECKSGPDELHPNAACDLEVKTGGNYIVKFGDPSF
jgi:hypothetical protein